MKNILIENLNELIKTLSFIKYQTYDNDTYERKKELLYTQRNVIKDIFKEFYKEDLSNKSMDSHFYIWVTNGYNIRIEYPNDFKKDNFLSDILTYYEDSTPESDCIYIPIYSREVIRNEL